MITANPQGKVLHVQVEPGSTTYIAAENPVVKGVFSAQIPESSVRSQFTVTDLLDGTPADEYLKYEGDHLIISSKLVAGRMQFEGLKIRLTGNDENRFEVIGTLTHADCVLLRSEKVGVVVSSYRYSDLANVAKAEEVRRAYFKAIQAAIVYQ